MLLGAAAILVLGSVGLCYLYLHNTGELRTLQAQAQQLNSRQQAVNALVSDVVIYSEKNPAIWPILESAGITNRPNRPEAKPASK